MGTCNPVPAPLFSAPEHRKSRSPAYYTPSPWGDFFLSHQPCAPSQVKQWNEGEVRHIVRDAFASSSDMAPKLELVDTLQRLGVGYHFKDEIDGLLRDVHHRDTHQHNQEGVCGDDADELYVTSLRFYLLRKHGYRVSSDVFVKFRDDHGNFASGDVNSLLVLYDAAHLRTRGEEVLDSAIAFTRIRLRSLIDSLEPELAKEVQCTKINHQIGGSRWDEQDLELFPAYMKALYTNILHNINDIIQELKLRNNSHAGLVKELLIDITRCYHAEVKWRDDHYVPAKVEEHLQLSAPSSACMHITNLAFISLGDVATREDIQWVSSYPKIIRSVCIIARISNDIMSHEVPILSLLHCFLSVNELFPLFYFSSFDEAGTSFRARGSTVQTCMKEHGFTAEQAREELGALVDGSWMDIVEECLDARRPMELLEKVVNLARGMDHMYKREDAYTFPIGLKDAITSVLVDSV
ncbi:hypothetical protein HU200_023461 [Digitaria exilis]|uniref:Uncharacterized protein n=1 Tax=Digitaria exilis TaxID=1010633 RepID=A0A835EUG8_9POAL|nr:hypothetical protein HU200_023461 [Digitaria exilis]